LESGLFTFNPLSGVWEFNSEIKKNYSRLVKNNDLSYYLNFFTAMKKAVLFVAIEMIYRIPLAAMI